MAGRATGGETVTRARIASNARLFAATNAMKSLDHIRIVLVRPIYGGNIGAVCRAMKNMGLSDLAIAAPRPETDWTAARQMATHADDVLARARRFDTLEAAVADCGLVFGTTARTGLYREHARSPREWAPRILEAAADTPVALVFGPEDRGLSNEELTPCNHFVRIPSAPAYPSLNLSHAVMVCAYELFVAAGVYEPPVERSPEATSEHRERMFALWEKSLLAIGFMNEEKAHHMMLGLRRVFARAPLTKADVRILMGIARQTLWVAERYREAAGHPPAEDHSET